MELSLLFSLQDIKTARFNTIPQIMIDNNSSLADKIQCSFQLLKLSEDYFADDLFAV